MVIQNEHAYDLAKMQLLNPDLNPDQSNRDVIKAASDYAGIFFSEYVRHMLDEIEMDDEDGTYDLFKGFHAQVLGEKLVNSPAGQNLTQSLIIAIQELQDKAEESHT